MPARFLAVFALCALAARGATFGRVVPLVGGATDIALDEARGQIYLTSSAQGLVQIYSIQTQSFLAPIATDATPLSLALSRDGKFLYVTCYNAATLDVIDLDALAVSARISLPARPEGVAVASDDRVLISTSGAGTAGAANVLLLYNPSPNATPVVTALSVTPGAAAAPVFPAPFGRPFLAAPSRLRASRDGSLIAGVNVPGAGVPFVFVYETASSTVLRSRAIAGASGALSISDDGTRILAGVHLFDTATLQVLAQQNLANAPYPIDPTTNFAAPGIQGGSVFSPDGQTLYAAYNVAPVPSPPGAVISQLTMNDPDNLLIHMGIQLPENLAGKMVMSADGSSAYALSDSGFVILPLGTISQSPLAAPASSVVLLTSDQCAVTAPASSMTVAIDNPGRGRIAAMAQLLQYTGQQNQASPATAPSARPSNTPGGPAVQFGFNPAAARGPGTIAPPHDFAILSPEAINIPDRVRVYENNRDSESRASVIPIPVGISGAQGLQDLILDPGRQRLYIANAGLNRVEVFDLHQQNFLAPIKVGQLPNSIALTPDGTLLYVANAGGENISLVDPNKMQTIGRLAYPAIPFNANFPLVTPQVIAAGLSGPEVLMSNGALWRVVGATAAPRGVSTIMGQTPQGAPVPIPLPSTMASTPDGRYILLATSTGFVYLYDAAIDDFIAGRQISTTPAQAGYVGSVAAGPGGQYFVVNGIVLNQALVAQPSNRPPGLVSAAAAVGNASYAIFSPPAAAAANAVPANPPTVQMINTAGGPAPLQVNALEGPLTQVTGAAGRAIVAGRTMVVDPASATAYAITISGLSIIPLAPVMPADRPLPYQRGAVNLASYQMQVAPNGWLSVFGQNLGDGAVAGSTPLPLVLGGSCVTLNNVALPLDMTSSGQINAHIPPNLAPGTYSLVVRSIARQAASPPQPVTVSRYAPAVLVDSTGQLALFHANGTLVNKNHPASRDEPLSLYAVGLGPTTGGAVTAGQPSPSSPLAVTGAIQVFFGDPSFTQAAVIVDWSGLAPGLIGVYQLNLRVPGFHMKGDALPVTVRVGGVSSPTTGPVVPMVAVN